MGAAEESKPEEKKAEEEVKKPEKEEEVKKPEKEEEVKKPEKEEEKKPEKEEEKKPEESKEPPPPEDIVLKVFMHCEGCARKVRRCLKGFEGVEDVQTDCKTHKVVVKGEKADPLKVLDRVQRKSHRKVELLSALPKPPPKEEKKEENIKPEEEKKKKEEEVIITVVLKVHMHCEACAQEIQKRIMRMKGVKTAEADLKCSQVTVQGVFDPPKLVEYVYKRTGKHAMIVKTEPEKKEEEKAKEEKAEKKEEPAKGDEEKKDAEEAKPAEEEAKKPEEGGGGEEATKVEVMEFKTNEYYYYPPKYPVEYAYPPQIFSDENPNACSVM